MTTEWERFTRRLKPLEEYDLPEGCIEKWKADVREKVADGIAARAKVKLVQVESGDKAQRYMSVGLRPFFGDCRYCDHFEDRSWTIADIYVCLLDNGSCGYGFICPHNTCAENVGWPEFEKIREDKI